MTTSAGYPTSSRRDGVNARRALIDRRVICDLPGFDADVYQAVRRLAAKRRAAPSIHGGKARPSVDSLRRITQVLPAVALLQVR